MSDYRADSSGEQDSEIRRRAAWLLGMLGLVAALLVLLMVTFFNSSGGGSDTPDAALPASDPAQSSTVTSGGSPAPSRSTQSRSSARSSSPSGSPSSLSDTGAADSGSTKVSCPSEQPCSLDSDVGNAVDAINAYRTSENKSAVPGSVSDAAKQCALARGSGCKGGWAETELSLKNGKADGEMAVEKIKQFAKLLSDMKSIEVGWAYDPGSKTLYFATIRQD